MSLRIVHAFGLVTVQDFGRTGHMHEGLPHGGALVPELLVRANRAARNPDGAAAIEVLGQLTIRVESPIVLATDVIEPRVLHGDEELTVTSEPRRVVYLAVRGGVEAPIVLGSRSTHLSAGFGAPLRAGARITAGSAPIADAPREAFIDSETIRVIPGPDALELAQLTAAPYTILPASDRVGTRLQGPPIPTPAVEASRPMVLGAVEVPGDGQPIVLGPEHPTTGGYPVIAVIASGDLGRFFAIRAGGSVRFVTGRSG